MQHTLITQE